MSQVVSTFVALIVKQKFNEKETAMVNRISRTNIPLKDPYLFPLETEPTEILEAMNLIVEHSENTGFTDNLLFYLQKPISAKGCISMRSKPYCFLWSASWAPTTTSPSLD